MRVLLSIKPEHVQNILSGTKTFEFRRKVFSRKDVKTVIMYCTMPIGLLVGEFDITEIIQAEPDDLWKFTCCGSGITKKFFDEYFLGRDKAYAIKIGQVRAYQYPIEPCEVFDNFTPPQSFMYVDSKIDTRNTQEKMEFL